MAQQQVPAAIEAYFQAVNARDWEALANVFAEDVRFQPVGSRPRAGREDVLAYYPPLLEGFAAHHDEPVRIHVAGDVVTVEIAFEGRTIDGAEVRFDAVELFELDADGRIRRLSLWYDTREVARHVRASTPRA